MTSAPDLVGTYQDSEGGDGHQCCPRYSQTEARVGACRANASGALRYLKYRSAFALLETNCLIHEPTTTRSFERPLRACGIVHAKLFAVAVVEIKFSEITMQVRFADMLINTIHAAFQDREKSFDGIGGDDPAAFTPHVFVFAMRDEAVRSKIPAMSTKAFASSVMKWLFDDA